MSVSPRLQKIADEINSATPLIEKKEEVIVVPVKTEVIVPVKTKEVVVIPRRGYSYYFGFILLIIGIVMLAGFIAGAVLTSSSTQTACIILAVIGGILALFGIYLIWKGRRMI